MPPQEKPDLTPVISLTGCCAEFRIALQAELQAAERHANAGAVPISNGEQIGRLAHLTQYRFTLESFLNVPGDMPADLMIPGHARIPTTIVSVDGLTVILSVEEQLPQFIPNALLKTSLAYLLRQLITRIEAAAGQTNSAGDRILGTRPVSGKPTPIDQGGLNQEQLLALSSCLGRDTTFIWGPPGTGKTETIGRIAEHLCRLNRSVLLVSHTNTAVNEALLRAASFLGTDLKEGQLIRVGGGPKNESLKDRPDLLLETLVERKQAEQTARKAACQQVLAQFHKDISQKQEWISRCEWAEAAAAELHQASGEIDTLTHVYLDVQKHNLDTERLSDEISALVPILEEANQVLVATRNCASLQRSLQETSTVTASLVAQIAELATLAEKLEQAQEAEPFRQRLKDLPPRSDLESAIASKTIDIRLQTDNIQGTERLLAEAIDKLAMVQKASSLKRMWAGLPSPEEQASVVTGLRTKMVAESITIEHLKSEFQTLSTMIQEITELEAKLLPFVSLPPADAMWNTIAETRKTLTAKRGLLETHKAIEHQLRANIRELERRAHIFSDSHHTSPEAVTAKMTDISSRLKEMEQARDMAKSRHHALQTTLDAKLTRWMATVTAIVPVNCNSDSLLDRLSAIQSAHRDVVAACAKVNRRELTSEIDQITQKASSISRDIALIETASQHVADLLIAEATLVATTLTGAYLRDAIQARPFDTVILDEASMAPIPALWIAARRATTNVVVVGDFKQLPPIVLSNEDIAQKWLGRDIFRVGGITSDKNELQSPTPSHFIALKKQHRMHPQISSILNDLIYDGCLDDAPGVALDKGLANWHRTDWGHDSPVLLVDMMKTNAWVTSVAKGAGVSRLNFLSATVCVDIAEMLFRSEFLQSDSTRQRKVLIVCPYSAHAKLVRLLIKHQGLSTFVEAGTIHSFQGSQAPVVIFDLVNDEPHWKVGLFTPARDPDNRRLINVAVSRAQHRLIVVGDFDYCKRLGHKAFLGGLLIPYLLQHYPVVDAVDVVPTGMASRAARASQQIVGGPIELTSQRAVVTQRDFYRVFCQDIDRASSRIVIYSPFITRDRLGHLEPHLKAAVERGVHVYVVTKAHGERGNQLQEYLVLERTLAVWGVKLVHKLRMHEKLIFVDNTLLWSGSLNPLSFSNTQEIMERRESSEVVEDYGTKLLLEDLLHACDAGEMHCPVCGSEVVTAEGKDVPIYFRCIVDGCFSRNVGDPMPSSGSLVCSSCGGELQFGKWGDDFAWRCVANPRHHMRIHAHHLKLPPMLTLIPAGKRKAVLRSLGVPVALSVEPPTEEQPLLFTLPIEGEPDWCHD